MKKEYISPEVTTFCVDVENIIAQSISKDDDINNNMDHEFHSRENDSSISNESLWDNEW